MHIKQNEYMNISKKYIVKEDDKHLNVYGVICSLKCIRNTVFAIIYTQPNYKKLQEYTCLLAE